MCKSMHIMSNRHWLEERPLRWATCSPGTALRALELRFAGAQAKEGEPSAHEVGYPRYLPGVRRSHYDQSIRSSFRSLVIKLLYLRDRHHADAVRSDTVSWLLNILWTCGNGPRPTIFHRNCAPACPTGGAVLSGARKKDEARRHGQGDCRRSCGRKREVR